MEEKELSIEELENLDFVGHPIKGVSEDYALNNAENLFRKEKIEELKREREEAKKALEEIEELKDSSNKSM